MESWYVNIEGKPEGPFSKIELLKCIREKECGPSSLVYKLGERDWSRLEDREELRTKVDTPLDEPAFSRVEIPAINADWIVLKKSENGFEQLGPLSESEVQSLIHAGEIQFTDHYWKNGMEKWEPISNFGVQPTAETSSANRTALQDTESNRSELLGEILFQHQVPSEVSTTPEEASTLNLAKDFGVEPLKWEVENSISATPFLEKEEIREETVPNSSSEKPSPKVAPEIGVEASLGKELASPKNLDRLSNLILAAGAGAILILTGYWFFKPDQKALAPSPSSIRLAFGQNGLEIDVVAPKAAKQSIDLVVESVAGQILSKNPFHRRFRIQLNKNGRAKIRLDQWSPSDGNYRATVKTVGGEYSKTFFIGAKSEGFPSRLEVFKEEMRTPISEPKEVKQKRKIGREIQALYKFSRDLEEGASSRGKSVMEWNAFYQNWLKSYFAERDLAFKAIEEEFPERSDLVARFKSAYDGLEAQSEEVDSAIRQRRKILPMNLSRISGELLEELRDQ